MDEPCPEEQVQLVGYRFSPSPHFARVAPSALWFWNERGYWFYLDDRDQESKATFLLMLNLVRLNIGAELLGGPLRAPILSLPLSR